MLLVPQDQTNVARAGFPVAVGVQFTDGEGEPIDPGTVTVSVTRGDLTTFVPAGGVTGSGTAARAFALSASEAMEPDRLVLVCTPSASGVGAVTAVLHVVGDLLFTLTEAKAWENGALSRLDDDVLLEGRARIWEAFHRICGVAFGARWGTGMADAAYGDTLYLSHGDGDAPFAGRAVLRMLAVRSVHTRTSLGASWMAYTQEDIEGLQVLPGGGVLRGRGSWVAGPARTRMGFVHGYAVVPLEVRRAALRLLRFQALESDIPTRATSFNSEEGTFTLATAGMRGAWFGLPEVDSVLDRFVEEVPVIL